MRIRINKRIMKNLHIIMLVAIPFYCHAQHTIHLKDGTTKKISIIKTREKDYIYYKKRGGEFHDFYPSQKYHKSKVVKVIYNDSTVELFDHAAISSSLASQRVRKSRTFDPNDRYYIGGQWINQYMWFNLMKANPEAWAIYERGCELQENAEEFSVIPNATLITSGVFFFLSSFGALGSAFSFSLEGVNNTKNLLYGSLVGIGLSIIGYISAGMMYVVGEYYKNTKSIRAYNESVTKKKSAEGFGWDVDLNLGLTSVGVSLNF